MILGGIREAIDAVAREGDLTLRLLERLPASGLTRRLGAGGRDLGGAAWHLSESLSSLAGFMGMTPDPAARRAPVPQDPVEIHERYRVMLEQFLAHMGTWSDGDLDVLDVVYGESWTRRRTLLILLLHQAHHRGQLTVGLRDLFTPLPEIYGPVGLPVEPSEEGASLALATDGDVASFDAEDIHILEPRVRVAWMIESALLAAFLGGGAWLAELYWLPGKDWWTLPFGWSSLALFGLFFVSGLVFPRYQYRAWRYCLRRHDVVLWHGVFWRVQRSVPRSRIQHVDVRSGPLDRMLGLAKLGLFTAGTGEDDATIPGLDTARAEWLRDILLADVLRRA